MKNLPSQREVLTSLVDAISSASVTPITAAAEDLETSPGTRLLRGADDSENRRQILLTLHVLLPNILLPALDLLDRQLVTRLYLKTKLQGAPKAQSHTNSPISSDRACTEEDVDKVDAVAKLERSAHLYIVKSLASTAPRRSREPTATTTTLQTYIVRLEAWNCSCAGFMFEAFSAKPIRASAASSAALPANRLQSIPSFGGSSSSLESGNEEDLPCCKHLLACMLADGRNQMLSNCVQEQEVTKDELAGIVADL